ncbi:NuoI/complex I 23 kDa subunit family protein [Acetonema longum]|uniref:Proton-translocating NADH-ubiquinone oxidoreductase, 23 kd, chain i n=1 Tax=Acetonema longum DSM 6540 TaxID=1009370 RepID=F7NDE4_9FIRM|nr:NADH-quinone oxidoreductase subunit I [Acetonema longum]EGO65976.1 proton-translocating NADH-ubiquinone oxidoreductase, 23 kd, chain i [Acetonema longum DSM 6540]
MYGKGLLKGMALTLKVFFSKKDTVQYPEQKLTMSPRYRGGQLLLDTGKCIACGLCAMSCPNAAIVLAAEMNQETKKKQLTEYRYLSGYCLYCNLCMEACPTHAIAWDRDYEITSYHSHDLEYDCLKQNCPAAKEGVLCQEK